MRSVLMWATCGVAMLPTDSAWSNCAPSFEVFATLPAHGATNIPTNAHIAVFGVGIGAVTLNDVELLPNQVGIYEPDLTANTLYQLRMEGIDYSAGGVETFEIVEFSTAAGPTTAAPPPAPVVASGRVWVEQAIYDPDMGAPDDPPSSKCLRLATSTGCADEGGADVYYATATVQTDAAVAWLVTGGGHPEFDQLWPSTCGDPFWHGYWIDGCYEVHAVSELGRVSAPTTHCFDLPSNVDESSEDATQQGETDNVGPRAKGGSGDEGCSSVTGNGRSVWWLVVVAGAIRRSQPRGSRKTRDVGLRSP